MEPLQIIVIVSIVILGVISIKLITKAIDYLSRMRIYVRFETI